MEREVRIRPPASQEAHDTLVSDVLVVEIMDMRHLTLRYRDHIWEVWNDKGTPEACAKWLAEASLGAYVQVLGLLRRHRQLVLEYSSDKLTVVYAE